MTTGRLRRYLTLGLCMLAAPWAVHPPTASAQAYPGKSVSLIVPFPPGGRTDLIGRIVAQNLQVPLKGTVVVVNRPGASSVLGSQEVSRAQPDGHTLGMFSTSFVVAQYTVATPIVAKDYDLLGIVNVDPAAVAVNESAPWKSLKELVGHARANPGKLRIGTIPGASAQIFSGALENAAGIKLVSVPFKGDADGAIALAGGHIDVHVAVPVSYKALIAAKKVRMLAIAAEERMALYGDVPTYRENGVNLVIGAFHGVYAPLGLPAQVREAIVAALEKTMTDKETVDRMSTAGAGILFRKGDAAKAFLAQQDAAYRRIIDELGMRVTPAK